MLKDLLAITTLDAEHPLAKQFCTGFEIGDYMYPIAKDAIPEKQRIISRLMDGFSKFSFHGACVNYDDITKTSEAEFLRLYNESYNFAKFHNISEIVFHANYVAGQEAETLWIKRQSAFWKQFLQDKQINIYLENLVDDTPELMAELCDTVNDPRFKICLDVGHALCNSKTIVLECNFNESLLWLQENMM